MSRQLKKREWSSWTWDAYFWGCWCCADISPRRCVTRRVALLIWTGLELLKVYISWSSKEGSSDRKHCPPTKLLYIESNINKVNKAIYTNNPVSPVLWTKMHQLTIISYRTDKENRIPANKHRKISWRQLISDTFMSFNEVTWDLNWRNPRLWLMSRILCIIRLRPDDKFYCFTNSCSCSAAEVQRYSSKDYEKCTAKANTNANPHICLWG